MSRQDQEFRFLGYYPSRYANQLTDHLVDTQEMQGPILRDVVFEKMPEVGIPDCDAWPDASIGSYLSSDTPIENHGKGIRNLQSKEPPIRFG